MSRTCRSTPPPGSDVICKIAAELIAGCYNLEAAFLRADMGPARGGRVVGRDLVSVPAARASRSRRPLVHGAHLWSCADRRGCGLSAPTGKHSPPPPPLPPRHPRPPPPPP